MLNIKDFTTALEIISKSHSTELAINQVSSQITIVTLNKVGIVLTFVSSNLGLYITHLQN